MAKFMILYSSTMSARDTMANSTPEQMKASMKEWVKWQETAGKTFKMEWGLPLQPVGKISSTGVTDSDSHVSGYATAEGDSKDALIELLKTHPHLQRPESSIDVHARYENLEQQQF
ncbi:hypothetical protein KW794_01565 [Candidatus Saccharibacteria bacterium]|nr:hypothetical protein [Candidatus Saccharibacteria bacterium]